MLLFFLMLQDAAACKLYIFFFLYLFYRSTIVRFAWSLGFFIPATTANDLRL